MTSDLDFASATVALRPPRVAIMVADDDKWREWAMTALSVASGYWGGAGFILVPFDVQSAKPTQEFADIVRAYDPDHVVSLDLPWNLIDAWFPNSVPLGGIESEEERRNLIARSHHHDTLAESDKAREEVVSWCSPMRAVRFNRRDASRTFETVTKLRFANPDDHMARGLAPAPPPTDWRNSRLAASGEWRSDVGLLAALRVGVAQSESRTGPRVEPAVEDLGWLVRPIDDAPSSLIWNPTQIPTQSSTGLQPWFTADQRLIQVSSSYLEYRAAVVIGDRGSDFAMAVAYDRIIGNGVWLPRSILADEDVFRRHVQPATWTLASDLEASGIHMAVTSVSSSPDLVDEVAQRLVKSPLPSGIHVDREARESTAKVGAPTLGTGYLEYLVDEHIGAAMSISFG